MAIQQDSLVELVKRDPFRPFRILTASGKEYLVQNPDLVHVMRAEIFYAFPSNDRWTIIPLSHITSIEVEQAA